ncbi:MAG: hypothetical protein KGL18_03285 [Burkholderiales bacterium]|nr:hypothetical protein [Burkholderiales bacterium]MDE1926565.1 hypothetical protein [Burkholderiales bacterium]MDE2159423.1 hypothetical protein [Burkholderiales bacterium]MDE2501989.1 hypothetical protein [Burkholderiales bacterium]
MQQDKFLLDAPAVNVVMISATHAQRASARFGAWHPGAVDASATPPFLSCCTTLDGRAVMVDSKGAIAPLVDPAARPEAAPDAPVRAWQREFRGWGADRAAPGPAA